MQRREHGGRLCQGDPGAHAGQRAFRARAHQCAHRHRRGGEEPDAAAGAGRRRADRRGQIEFLCRSGRDGALGRGHLGAHSHAGLRARGYAARRRPGAARPPDGRAEPADRCAGRALRRQDRPARAATGAGAVASRSRERAPAGRCACERRASAHSRRSRRGACGGGGGTGRAGRAHRRAAGDLDLRAWAVCRQPLVGRHQRRLCLAGGGRADLRERSHRRVRREPDALDHEAGQADRARCRGRANRRRGGQARVPDAGPACRPGRCPGGRAGDPGRVGQARHRPARGTAQRRDAQADRRRRQPQRALSGHVDRPTSSIRAR